MTTTYTYHKIDDFGSGINPQKLMTEIRDQLSTIKDLTIHNNSVDTIFPSALSAGDKTTLDGIIAAHALSALEKYSSIIEILPRTNKNRSTKYKRLATYIYEGSDNIGEIKKILLVANMDEDNTQYTIKILDETNGNIIAETTFFNTEEAIIEMTPLSNIPRTRSILEIQAKKTGGKNSDFFWVDSITVYLE